MVGFGAVILDLDVDERTGTGVECFRKIGNRVGEVRPQRGSDEATVGQMGIMVDHRVTVEAATNVEFDSVGTESYREFERGNGVLRSGSAGATVGDHECHAAQPNRRVDEMSPISK